MIAGEIEAAHVEPATVVTEIQDALRKAGFPEWVVGPDGKPYDPLAELPPLQAIQMIRSKSYLEFMKRRGRRWRFRDGWRWR